MIIDLIDGINHLKHIKCLRVVVESRHKHLKYTNMYIYTMEPCENLFCNIDLIFSPAIIYQKWLNIPLPRVKLRSTSEVFLICEAYQYTLIS